MIAAAIVHTFNYDRDFHIPAEEVVAHRECAHPPAGKPCLRSRHASPGAAGADLQLRAST